MDAEIPIALQATSTKRTRDADRALLQKARARIDRALRSAAAPRANIEYAALPEINKRLEQALLVEQPQLARLEAHR